jgi:lactate 2-monooxygenase
MDPSERAELERRYTSGERRWPIGFDAWQAAAEAVLDRRAFNYVAGGAGTESTMRANGEAFYPWRLRPRMLTGHAERDLSVEVLGLRSPSPFWLAPVGVLSLMHPDGELAVCRAAAAAGIPYCVSSAASHSMEDMAKEMGAGHPKWFQFYWPNDREVAASFIERAANAGYGAIVVTVDTLTLGWRDRDMETFFLPFLEGGQGIAQYASDPVFRSRLSRPPDEDWAHAGGTMVGMFQNLALSWNDLEWLAERTALPVLLKGILTAEDAVRARDAGIDGVVVSNHGGRQVDGAVAALDALVEVREAVGPDYPVVMDSGIRRGADVLKAIALGANGVQIGRPYAWGLAVGGEAGVREVLTFLAGETDVTAALIGARSTADLDRSFVSRA